MENYDREVDGKTIKNLITNNHMKVCRKEFNEFCNEGILRHHLVRHAL